MIDVFTFQLIFYGLSAIAVGFLLRRYWRRRKTRLAESAPTAAARSETTASEVPAAPAPAGDVPPPHVATRPPAPPANVFPGLRRKRETEAGLPHIEADETPLLDPAEYVFGPATPALAAMLPESESRRADVKRDLKNAGFYQPVALTNLSAIRYLCVMFPMVALGGLLLIAPPAAERYLLLSILIVPALGWAFPRLYVKSKAADRTSKIEQGMPDMLDMLNMCVSQGMTVPHALKRVSQELPQVHPALYKELQIVAEQAQIGTLRHALENFSRRIDVPEVHSFTTLLIQTERMGTSVSTALAEYSDNMRASLKQRADEKANRAAFKLLFPTVLCLMPAVYMFLLGPSIVELTNFLNRDALSLDRANTIIQRTGQPVNRGR